MLISLKWLKKLVPQFQIATAAEFKETLDTRLSEVESLQEVGKGLEKLVIARVESVEQHPKHEHLSVCQVNVGEKQTQQIVCGADNVHAGMYTVAVLPGGKVYSDAAKDETMKISVRKVAGVDSAGMLCAPDELGLSDEHDGIIAIDASMAPGTDVTEMFSDVVLEIENKALPHRPDAFSHLGIAREVSAIFNTPLEFEAYDTPRLRSEQKITVGVENRIPKLVSRYSGLSMTNVKVGPSPLWLQLALARTGERTINNVVDITNYVMLHLGQPLHAFDTDKLVGQKLVVRKASSGEKLVTLDHVERELTDQMVVIADTQKAIALGGIMGGENTAISNETTNIFLEAANFEMYNIRRTSRALGLRSQASSRYEKGISPATTLIALNHAAELILSVCGGEVSDEPVDIYPEPEKSHTINFDIAKVKRLAGVTLEKKEIQTHLQNLGFTIDGIDKFTSADIQRNQSGLIVKLTVPEWRQDISIDEDVVEEIARLHGYDQVQLTLPARNLEVPNTNRLNSTLFQIKQRLAAAGLHEIYTYTLVGPDLYHKAMLEDRVEQLPTIMEPLSPELSLVRDHVLPSMLEKLPANLDKYDSFGLFEISRVVRSHRQDSKEEQLPAQPFQLVALFVGDEIEDTYRQLKYAFEQLNHTILEDRLYLEKQNGTDSLTSPIFHPGRSGIIDIAGVELNKTLDKKSTATQKAKRVASKALAGFANLAKNKPLPLGEIGMIHPTVLKNFGIKNKQVAAFTLELSRLFEQTNLLERSQVTREQGSFKEIVQYPIVDRDISFWQASKTLIGKTINSLKQELGDNLFSIRIVDIFDQGERRSITLKLKLVAHDHTLSSEEISTLMGRVNKVIQNNGHELR